MSDSEKHVDFLTSQLLMFLNRIEGFSEFIETNKPSKNFLLYLELFKRTRENVKPFSSQENLMFTLAKEKVYDLQKIHTPKICFFDPSLRRDETIIEQFRDDFDNCKSGNKAFKDAEVQHYRTWKETYLYEEVKDNGLTFKYRDAEHPLIYVTLAQAIINAGKHSIAYDFLLRNFKFINSVPNIFWHSPYGLFGCWQTLWLLGNLLHEDLKKIDIPIYMKYFKLLFLFMSRAIEVGVHLQLPQPFDIYRNRANILRNQRSPYMVIFADKGYPVANMDIQFISDCFLAFSHISKCGEPGLGEQELNDSRKMYTYGSLNNLGCDDDGYKWIEDCDWLECVEKGRLRSIDVASKLCDDFENGLLSFSSEEWEKICFTIFSNPKNLDHNVPYHWTQF